jgi:hypothetical protein
MMVNIFLGSGGIHARKIIRRWFCLIHNLLYQKKIPPDKTKKAEYKEKAVSESGGSGGVILLIRPAARPAFAEIC